MQLCCDLLKLGAVVDSRAPGKLQPSSSSSGETGQARAVAGHRNRAVRHSARMAASGIPMES
jgi:hypothetical protein